MSPYLEIKGEKVALNQTQYLKVGRVFLIICDSKVG